MCVVFEQVAVRMSLEEMEAKRKEEEAAGGLQRVK